MTDQEINEAVARKLGYCATKHRKNGCLRPYYVEHEKDFCHSIAAAWEVVELIANKSEKDKCGPMVELSHDGKWHFRIGLVQVKTDTAPMAICLAFLKIP